MGERRGVAGQGLAPSEARRWEKVSKRGFTYIELSYAMAIITILMLVLTPAFTRSREKAKTADCQSHLKQIGMALQVYAHDWNGHFPPGRDDLSPLLPYLRESTILLCPTAEDEGIKPPHYWYRPGHAFDDLPDVPLAGDMRPWHGEGGNALFVDGHVKWFSGEQFEHIRKGMRASEVKVKFRKAS